MIYRVVMASDLSEKRVPLFGPMLEAAGSLCVMLMHDPGHLQNNAWSSLKRDGVLLEGASRRW